MPAAPAAPRPKPVKQRYFPGRAPQGAPVDADSDSDDDEEEQVSIQPKRAAPDENSVAGGAGRVVQIGSDGKPKTQMKLALRDVKVENGKVLLGGEDKAAGEL